MFLSLNKKVIIAIVAFFILCFGLFGYTLYSLYNSRIQEDQSYLHTKNQQYNELLYYYNKTQKGSQETAPKDITPFSQNSLNPREKENIRYSTLEHNLYMILACLTFFAIMIILMIVFMHNLIFTPLAYISQINQVIQKGIYKQRLKLPPRLIHDEFNNLEQTYNNMLDNIEEQISQINTQKDFLQKIIDGMPDAIRVLDFSGNIVLANDIYRKNLEQTKHPSSQKIKCYTSLFNKKMPCSSSSVHCPLQELKDKHTNIKFIQQLPYGKRQYLSVNASRIDTTQQPLIIESFRDLSNDIKFSHQQKISSLGFLTTAIAHEIKNNLGSMRLILENLIHNKLTKEEIKKYNELVYTQILECIKIPERLLSIARATPDNRHEIKCHESISEICALLDYEATHNGINIQIKGAPNIKTIYGNETDFKMILLNLAQNAIKAMPFGGSLTFSIAETEKHLLLKISDTGKGISKENLTHIFEPFFSENTTDVHTGLGLAIVKSLMNSFNGDISVHSQIEKGTTFTLKFPYKNKK